VYRENTVQGDEQIVLAWQLDDAGEVLKAYPDVSSDIQSGVDDRRKLRHVGNPRNAGLHVAFGYLVVVRDTYEVPELCRVCDEFEVILFEQNSMSQPV
jgi:hypothetical protein